MAFRRGGGRRRRGRGRLGRSADLEAYDFSAALHRVIALAVAKRGTAVSSGALMSLAENSAEGPAYDGPSTT